LVGPYATTTAGQRCLIVAFLVRMETVSATNAAMCVLNMDEATWRLINHQMSTTANIGLVERSACSKKKRGCA
jgi:hypothetical protein